MSKEEVKIKMLEDDLAQRNKQIILLTSNVEELNRQIETNVQVIELSEKVKMLESQNGKLIEKNQSDVVEWKTKEREFNQQLKALKTKVAELEEALEESKTLNQQLMASQDPGMAASFQKITQERDLLASENAEQITLNQTLLAQIKEKDDKLKLLQEQNQSAGVVSEQITSLQKELQDRDNKLKLLQEQLANSSGHAQKIEVLEQQINDSQQLHATQKAEIERLQNLLNQNAGQSSVLSELQNELKLKQEENEKLNKLFQEYSCKNDTSTLQLSKANQDIEILKNQTDELTKTIQQNSVAIKQKEDQIKELQQQQAELKLQYKDEMTKMIQINEKLQEKMKHESDQWKSKLQEQEKLLSEAKKAFEVSHKQVEKENATLLAQLQQANSQSMSQQKQILDLQYKIKDLENQLSEKSRQYVKQLEHSKQIGLELKQYITQFRQAQEQLQQAQEEISKSNILKLKLLQDNQDLKNKLESFLSSNNKQRNNEVSQLKALLNEKDEEIKLLNSQFKSLSIQTKTSNSYAARYKARVKQLEGEYTELLKKHSSLEQLFQEIVDSSKLRNNQLKNVSHVSVQPKYQMSLLSKRRDLLEEDMGSESKSNTTPNKIGKGEVSFKRPIAVSSQGYKKNQSHVSSDNLSKHNDLGAIDEQEESQNRAKQPSEFQSEQLPVHDQESKDNEYPDDHESPKQVIEKQPSEKQVSEKDKDEFEYADEDLE